MQNYINIFLKDHFADSISTRIAVRSLFFDLPENVENEVIIIDFSGIEFISLSAAHELNLFFRKFTEKGNKVEFLHTSDKVNRMLSKAKEPQKKNRPKQKTKHISFRSSKELINYFSNI